MQASVIGLGVQRVKLAGRGLSLLLGGLHPNVRHLQQHVTTCQGCNYTGVLSIAQAGPPAARYCCVYYFMGGELNWMLRLLESYSYLTPVVELYLVVSRCARICFISCMHSAELL